jgi:hypothetical protein
LAVFPQTGHVMSLGWVFPCEAAKVPGSELQNSYFAAWSVNQVGLFALLAASGMRIGEALGLRVEHLTDDFSTNKITQSAWRGRAQSPKTANAVREIDLHSSLAALLKVFVNERTDGYLFPSSSGRPLTARNVIDKFRIQLQLTQPGLGFHAFRRFRTSHLRKNRAPWDLEKFWLGHANKSVTDKYSEQLKEDVAWRKAEAERIGLGFSLNAKPSVGLLGLPEAKKYQSRKAAQTIEGLRIKLAPRGGFEPPTFRLTAERSTIELPGNGQARLSIYNKLRAIATLLCFQFESNWGPTS